MVQSDSGLLDGMRSCPPCKGNGRRFYRVSGSLNSQHRECEVCKGVGQIPEKGPRDVMCKVCYGKGRPTDYSEELCQNCLGHGIRTVPIPPAERSQASDGEAVFVVEAGKPYSAHLTLVELLASLGDTLRICDAYLGVETLPILRPIGGRNIRFLTAHLPSKKGASEELIQTVKKFSFEFKSTEFRQCTKAEFHDRYVLTEEELILLGHGLKDAGRKESFIVRLKRKAIGTMIDDLMQTFDEKWEKAEQLA